MPAYEVSYTFRLTVEGNDADDAEERARAVFRAWRRDEPHAVGILSPNLSAHVRALP